MRTAKQHLRTRGLRGTVALYSATLMGAAALLGACGEAAPGTPRRASATVTKQAGSAPAPTGSARTTASTTTTSATTTPANTTPAKASPHVSASVVAKIDASSDRILAEGKVHIAEGAPSDKEIRRELEAARKAGIPLPSGDSVSSFESAQGQSTGPAAGAEVPEAAWNPRGKPIADWIVPILEWASQHGWHGTVTSGFRTFYEQAQLNAAGAFSAPAGLSNHETTRYPGGAVDVTEPAQLIVVLRGYNGPLPLVGGVLGPIDPEHFSATGD